MQFPAVLIESNPRFGALLCAESGKTLSLTGGRATLHASDSAAPVFDVLAYNGGALNLPAMPLPVVFDLSEIEVASAGVPALYQHNHEKIVGNISEVVIDRTNHQIRAKAIANAVGETANMVRANARQGYEWQVSVGLHSNNLVEIQAGASVRVNGREFTGPLFVARANVLREISFVSVGADTGTFAKLLAASLKGAAMTYEEWLKSLGIDAAQWGEAETAAARRIFDAMQTAQTQAQASAVPDEEKAAQVQAAARTAVAALRAHAAVVKARLQACAATGTGSTTGAADTVAEMRRTQAAEYERISGIQSAARAFGVSDVQVNGRSLVASLIESNTSVPEARREFELHQLRANRPAGLFAGAANSGAGNAGSAAVLEAAIAQAGRMPTRMLEAQFNAQTLQAAHTQYRGRISLHQILLEAARANGYHGLTVKGNVRAVLVAAFSNISLPGIFSNTANKWLMMGFSAVEDSWRKIAATRAISDFKETTGYRGVGSFRMQPLASDGRIRHGTTGETAYGNKVDTRAIMYSISRQDIINDDLGALTDIPKGIGRGAIIALLRAFWAEFMDNAAFFVGGNNNLSTGALAIAGMNAALTRFRKQTDDAGDFVMATPRYLAVPTELEETAMQLYGSKQRGGGFTGDSDENPHVGKYEPVVSAYLSDTGFTGNSTTAYYLLADPNDVPVIEIAFLDGIETPTVETADAEFNTLGIEMRGYFDFGVRKQEFRGGVKSTGV